MKIDNAIALVTGANCSIGVAFTRELLARGAPKVHAGARDPSTVTQPLGENQQYSSRPFRCSI